MTAYVSIPVHDSVPVIIDQVKNFASFMPNSCVVLHVSAGATFELSELEGAISTAKLDTVIVNPERLQTGWGNVLAPHISNAGLIAARPDASSFVLHASNDMLVRPGAEDYIAETGYGYIRRPISNSYWTYENLAKKDARLLAALGGADLTRSLTTSQPEGSFYPIDFLTDALERWTAAESASPEPAPYPQEESVLPSLAAAYGASGVGTPTIFSEVYRTDYWKAVHQKRFPFLSDEIGKPSFGLRMLSKIDKRIGRKTPINRATVDGVRNNVLQKVGARLPMRTGTVEIYRADRLYGVKRVARVIDDPVRVYIRSLTR